MLKMPFLGPSLLVHLSIISTVKVKEFLKKDRKRIISLVIFSLIALVVGGNIFFFGFKGIIRGGFVNSDLIRGFFSQEEKIEPRSLAGNKVVLRIDDIQAYSWRNISIKMIEDALARKMPVVLGVIPLDLLEDDKLVGYNIGGVRFVPFTGEGIEAGHDAP